MRVQALALVPIIPAALFAACSSPSANAPGRGSASTTASTGSASGTAVGSATSHGSTSGEDSGASCSDVSGCGGSVVGTWTATSSCLTVSGALDLSAFGFASGCSSAPVTGNLRVTGTWTGRADGTYSDDTVTSGEEQFTLGPSCLVLSSTPITCQGAAGFLEVLGYTSVTCTDATGGGCNCSGTVQQTGGMGLASSSPTTSGTYTTSAGVLTTSGSGNATYCASGAALTITPQSTSPTITGTIALQKSGAPTTSSSATASSGSSSTSSSSASADASGPITGPCDIYKNDASGSVRCVAAHSTVRALIGAYSGKLYQVRNAAGTTKDIGTTTAGGVADSSAQDAFCSGTTCVITTIYDQTGNGNDLQYQGAGSAVGGKDQPASAVGESVQLGGNKVYSLFIKPGNSYWVNGVGHGIPTGSQPEGMYMVTSGTHFNSGCCFDYGNSETDRKADGAGAMDAINFSTITAWGTGAGSGPWVTADLEFGLFTEATSAKNANDPTQTSSFVTAVLKNNGTTEWALRGADATSGSLSTYYKGGLPAGWSPMKKQGAIVLGSGGDCCATNTNLSEGTFYEGCLVTGYPSDATEAAVQANIVAAKYSK